MKYLDCVEPNAVVNTVVTRYSHRRLDQRGMNVTMNFYYEDLAVHVLKAKVLRHLFFLLGCSPRPDAHAQYGTRMYLAAYLRLLQSREFISQKSECPASCSRCSCVSVYITRPASILYLGNKFQPKSRGLTLVPLVCVGQSGPGLMPP